MLTHSVISVQTADPDITNSVFTHLATIDPSRLTASEITFVRSSTVGTLTARRLRKTCASFELAGLTVVRTTKLAGLHRRTVTIAALGPLSLLQRFAQVIEPISDVSSAPASFAPASSATAAA